MPADVGERFDGCFPHVLVRVHERLLEELNRGLVAALAQAVDRLLADQRALVEQGGGGQSRECWTAAKLG